MNDGCLHPLGSNGFLSMNSTQVVSSCFNFVHFAVCIECRRMCASMYVGGPVAVVVEGEWLEALDEKGSTGRLTRVQTNLKHTFNIHNRYVFLEDCEALNVALLLVDPTDITCNVFEVVDQTGRQRS
jgi:hypothetical protein